MINSPSPYGNIISDNSITTAKLINEAVTQIVASAGVDFNTNSANFVDITGCSATITTNGGKVLAILNTGHTAGSAGTTIGVVTILRDATNLGDSTWGLNGISAAVGVESAVIDSPIAGTYTYKGQLRADGGSGTIYVGFQAGGTKTCKLILIEVKK